MVTAETNAIMESSHVDLFASELYGPVDTDILEHVQNGTLADVSVGWQFQYDKNEWWRAGSYSQQASQWSSGQWISGQWFSGQKDSRDVPYVAIPILSPTTTMPTEQISASGELPSNSSPTMSFYNKDDNFLQFETQIFAPAVPEQKRPVIQNREACMAWQSIETHSKTFKQHDGSYNTSWTASSEDAVDCIQSSTPTHATMNSTVARLPEEVSNSSGYVGNSSLLTDKNFLLVVYNSIILLVTSEYIKHTKESA